ncbi:MAG: hypothetical protein J6Q84_01005 [Kiritimatiellae bacterium]|nr:hypothetical protein [Kiritimatiellia bacterium]
MNTNQNTVNETKYMSFQLDLTALNGRGIIFAALPIDIAANSLEGLQGNEANNVSVAKSDEILSFAKNIAKIVQRLDERGVKRGKRNEAIRVQDECYRYWELGRNKSAIVNATNAKVAYGDVICGYVIIFSFVRFQDARVS